jgi:hypothetical protein
MLSANQLSHISLLAAWVIQYKSTRKIKKLNHFKRIITFLGGGEGELTERRCIFLKQAKVFERSSYCNFLPSHRVRIE